MKSLRDRPLPFAVALVATLLAVTLGAVLYLRAVVPDLPALRQGETRDLALASVVLSADGEELARFFRENRTWVGLDAVVPVAVEALVAAEDRRFWRHGGVDLPRVVGAARETLRGRRQGASTLTMQLARNRFDAIGRAPDWRRKVAEVVAAVKIERRYTKPEIVELYLNTVPFGRRAHGIEQAARTFFDVSAARLDTVEAALLVALLRGPSRYDPLRHPERARARRDLVLGLMARHGVLSDADARRLARRPLGLRYRPPSSVGTLAPHFVEHVRRETEDWAARHGHDLYADGLRIHTTLDARLQRQAVAAVAHEGALLQTVAAHEWSRPQARVRSTDATAYTPPARPFGHFWDTRRDLLDRLLRRTPRYRRLAADGIGSGDALRRVRADAALVDSVRAAYARLEAGLVAVEPATGHVRAWVGGRDFGRDQYDKVATARRQPGSTFKPFVYAAALERGFAPDDTVRTAEGRALSLRDALAWSSNEAAFHLVRTVGPHAAVEMAGRLGIAGPLDAVPAIALGSEEVTLLELTGAYATLAAGGVHRPPVTVARIEDRHGRALHRAETTPRRVLDAGVAYTVVDLLRSAVDRGTGRDVRRRFDVAGDLAGKTGTSQRHADGWFVLAHPDLVIGTWTGFNDRRLHFRTDHWGAASHSTLRLAAHFARRAQQHGLALDARARFAPPRGYLPPRPFRTARADTVLAAPAADAHEAPRLERDAASMLRREATVGAAPARPRLGRDAEAVLRRRAAARTSGGGRE